jgi:hypothetical protein
MFGMSKERQKKRPRHVPRYLDAIRKEAFDLYCTGLSRRRVAAALQEKYGRESAPYANTVKRWMSQDRWTERRRNIREWAEELEDRQRILESMRLLHGLEELPFKSKGEAVRSMAQGQKVIRELVADLDQPVPQEVTDYIIDTALDILGKDEEVGPVLRRRWWQVLKRKRENGSSSAAGINLVTIKRVERLAIGSSE